MSDCNASCTNQCISTCGNGCAVSSTSAIKHINIDKVDNDYLFDVLESILRYIVTMGSKSDIITSLDSIFGVFVDPVYYTVNVTYNNSVEDTNGYMVPHRYENVFKINRITNDTTLIKKEYTQSFNYYTEDGITTVGNVDVPHKAGSRVVLTYDTYTEQFTENISYMIDGTHRTETRVHAVGDPRVRYQYYYSDEYDDNDNIIHYAGDVVLDDNNNPIVDYMVAAYDTYWQQIGATQEFTRRKHNNGIPYWQ